MTALQSHRSVIDYTEKPAVYKIAVSIVPSPADKAYILRLKAHGSHLFSFEPFSVSPGIALWYIGFCSTYSYCIWYCGV
jgi:hypothetical protein